MMLFRLIYLSFLFFISVNTSEGQINGQLSEYLNEWLEQIPGARGDDYQSPSDDQLSQWEKMVTLALSNRTAEARELAEKINYQILRYTDISGIEYMIVVEKAPKRYHWGILVLNQKHCRDIVLQAPHPIHDTNTGKQAIYCYLQLNAKALMISGSHRCSSSEESKCDGTTGVCSSQLEKYRLSDQAHSGHSTLQRTTEVIYNTDPNTVFIQLHGFGKRSSDPYVIISNGTRDTPQVDYATKIRDNLKEIDNILTFKIAHEDSGWSRLIGFTNVQGRWLNNSSDPCQAEAETVSGQFIHIEQERSRLRADSIGWKKMSQALARTFACTTTSSYYPSEVSDKYIIYPNPATGSHLLISGEHLSAVSIYDLLGNLIKSRSFIYNSTNIKLDISNLNAGVYLITVKQKNSSKTHFHKLIVTR